MCEGTVCLSVCQHDIAFCLACCISKYYNLSLFVSLQCFGHLCDEIEIVASDTAANTIAANYRVYRKLSTRVMTTGRAAQQKAIRNVLRRIDTPSPGNLTAWEDVFQRWKEYTPTVRAAVEAESMAQPLAPGQVHPVPAAPKKTRRTHSSVLLSTASRVLVKVVFTFFQHRAHCGAPSLGR